jgi:hypothetical protein
MAEIEKVYCRQFEESVMAARRKNKGLWKSWGDSTILLRYVARSNVSQKEMRIDRAYGHRKIVGLRKLSCLFEIYVS